MKLLGIHLSLHPMPSETLITPFKKFFPDDIAINITEALASNPESS